MPIAARDYTHLLGRLVGISDRALAQHLELYGAAVRRLADLEAAYPMVEWQADGQHPCPVDAAPLLGAPVASLDLRPVGLLAECLQELDRELAARGISFRPRFYLGDGEFWATDRAISVNIPWFLANPTLMRLAARAPSGVTYTADMLMKDLRHETGHALGYAFELWRRPEWTNVFGDFTAPYRENYTPDPLSRDYVEHTIGGRPHYAQKHADEDWAETFATWLDPASDWPGRYAEWPVALGKLRYVEALWRSRAFAGPATNTLPGRTVPYTSLRGTVGQLLGITAAARPLDSAAGDHADLLRQEPALRNAVVLHELYFESLDGAILPREPPPALLEAARQGWGSWESFLLDLRAIAGSTNGWALTCWDARAGRMRNALVEGHADGVLAGCPVLLAIDTWEHAFTPDYGAQRHNYLGAVFVNLNWNVVGARLARAVR